MSHAVSPQVFAQVKEVFDCWNERDFDGMLDMWADDGVFDVSAVFVDVPPTRGHADLSRCWHQLLQSLDGLRMDPVEVFSLGSRRYAVDMRLWGKGRQSGVEVDHRYGYVCAFGEDGKCLNARLLPDLASALAIGQEDASDERNARAVTGLDS
ncbi:MAG: nuclear transport factor 2 family protein [Chloroflexota bacterium]|nr:nuclear transport factor 2 family protein [Chloroflexota bacterium]